MLKNKLWIVALFAALTMAFFGCTNLGIFEEEETGDQEWTTIFQLSTDTGIQGLPVGALSFPADDNPIAPLVRAAEDVHADYEIIKVDGKNALKYVTHATWGPGFDLRDSTFSFKAGDKITVTGSATGSTIDLAWNKNQGGAQSIVGDRITATGPFNLVVTLTATDITAIKGNEQGVLRFEDRASSDTTVTITDVIIEGERPAGGVVIEPPAPPPEDILFTPGASAALDKVVDTSLASKVVTVTADSPYAYEFPTRAKNTATERPASLDIEKDYDFVEIEFVVSNPVGETGASQIDAQIVQFGTTTSYAEKTSNDLNTDSASYLNALTGTIKLNVQTWGSGGKGGVSIRVNGWNTPSGGGHGTAYTSFDMKVTKVTFTKGTRYSVKFYTPQTPNLNNIADLTVLSGNSLGSRLPSLSNPGWTFGGWCESWNDTTGNGTGTAVTSTTAISANKTLYAQWFYLIPGTITLTSASSTAAASAILAGISQTGTTPGDTNNAYKNTSTGEISVTATGNCTWGVNFANLLNAWKALSPSPINADVAASWYTGFTIVIEVQDDGSGGNVTGKGNLKGQDGWSGFGDYVPSAADVTKGAIGQYPNIPTGTVTLNFPLDKLSNGFMSQNNGGDAYTFTIVSVSFHNDMF